MKKLIVIINWFDYQIGLLIQNNQSKNNKVTRVTK